MPGRATAFRYRTPGVSRWANPRWLPEGRHRFDYHGAKVGPLGRAEACGKEQPGRPALRPRFAPPTGEQRRHQPPGELINEHQAAAGPEDPGALVKTGLLVRPVVERRSADYQVKGAGREREPLRRPRRELQPRIPDRRRGNPHHRRRGVHPGEFERGGAAAGKDPQQVPGAATDVEDVSG